MYKQIRIRVVFSIVLALLAGYFTFQYLNKLQYKVEVVVAKEVIEPNTKVTEDKLKVIRISGEDKNNLFPNAVTTIEELKGAVTRVKIEPNKPIEKDPSILVYGEEETMVLNYYGQVDEAYFIPYEKRLIAIEVDGSGSLNYKLKRGDFVDVIYTSVDEGKGGLFSNMVLQHVQIYDIENLKENTGNMVERKQKVLLMVTPEDSIKLTVAKRNGILDLVLNPLEGETEDIKPVHLLDMAADKPMAKSEMLKDLEEYIKLQEISETVKKQLVDSIEKEREVDYLKNMIEASKLSKEKKNSLLKLINE